MMSHIVLSQIKDKSVNLTVKKKRKTASENKRKTVISIRKT